MTEDAPTLSALERMLCFDLYAANHAFARVYKPLLEPFGLTYPQYLVMVTLWSDAPLSVGDIGTRLGLNSNTLTPMIKRLEAAGFVVRARDGADERRVRVDLTKRGRAMATEAEHVPQCVAAATGMSHAELRALQLQLRKISGALDAG
jgi:DNA-binding MarR family transcriptional regulator